MSQEIEKNNHKAFTLIELLVVVAIIGILAAVGVVAYNGYTNSAKKSSTKSNHSSIVKFMSAEIQKCNLGERTAMSGQLSCPITNSSQIIQAIHKPGAGISAAFKNPFNTDESAINISWYDYNNDANLGRTLMGQNAWNNVLIATCHETPCSNANNRTISYVYMD